MEKILLEYDERKNDIRRFSNQESNRLTRECICTALIFMMAEKEFDKITVTDIVNKSGVSRATFYRNYGTKENVLKEIVSEITSKIQNAFSDPLFITMPKMWLTNCFCEIKSQHKVYFNLLKAGISYRDLLDISFLANEENNINQDKKYKLIGFFNAFLSIVLEWLENDMAQTEEEMADIVLSILKI